jgi:hypothetical protein
VPLNGINKRHNAVEPKTPKYQHVSHERVKDRCRIGEARRLDHHPPDQQPAVHPVAQISQRPDQIAPHGAAKAPGVQQHGVLVECLNQQVVQTDLAELIDQDGRVLHAGLLEQAIEQRRLADPEKAGEHGNWDSIVDHHGWVVLSQTIRRSVLLHGACHLIDVTPEHGGIRGCRAVGRG